MKTRKLIQAALLCCLPLTFAACDDEDFPPSMAEQNIEKLESYHAKTYQINSDSADLSYADITGNYRIEYPYLVATINGSTYCFDMNKMLAIEYDEAFSYVTIFFE